MKAKVLFCYRNASFKKQVLPNLCSQPDSVWYQSQSDPENECRDEGVGPRILRKTRLGKNSPISLEAVAELLL